MKPLEKTYTSADLAAIFKISRQALEKRAAKEKWSIDRRQGHGGGNLYPYETLPGYVKELILAKVFNTRPEYIDTSVPAEHLAGQFAAFDRQPEHARAVARARADVLDACRQYIHANKVALTEGREQFCHLYGRGRAPGVKQDVYGLIKRFSPTTLWKWEGAFRQTGLAGLAPQSGKAGRRRIITPDMELRFVCEISAVPHTRGSGLVDLMKRTYPADQWVDRATVYRWHQNWKQKNAEHYAMLTHPGRWKNAFQPSFGSLARAPYAGHTWEMDSTPADIMTADGKRCNIVGAIDNYSRRMIVVISHTSKSDAVAACARKAFLAWGVPKIIMKDNGADYSSRHIEAVLTALDISAPPIKPYTPEGKGHIERGLGTMTRELEEKLPGYTGHSVEERAGIRARQTWGKRVMQTPADGAAVGVPLTMGEFQHICDAWINDVYENRPHTGFNRDPGRALKGLTPRQAFDQSPQKPPRFKDERALDILLTDEGERKVGKSGIAYLGGRYVCAELVDYIGRTVKVKINPENAGALYVFHHARFIGIARDEALTGQSLTEYMEARSRHQKEVKRKVRAARDLSRASHQPYTVELLSGRLSQAAGQTEAKQVIDFRPEFYNEAVQAARDAAAAEEGRTPAPAEENREPLKFNRVISPQALEQEDPWAKPGLEILGNTINIFEWYLKKQQAVGLTKNDAEMMIHLWMEYSEIQYLYQKPNRVDDTTVAVEMVRF